MAAARANINPAVLRWARVESGLSIEEAAEHAGIPATRDQTAAERLSAWEEGKAVPTRNQATDLAKAYYRPLLTFYLKAPPAQAEQVPDFRTVGDRPAAQGGNLLSALVRRMRARQREVVELLTEDAEDVTPLPFVGRFGEDADPQEVASDIRNEFAFDFEAQRALNNPDSLFRTLREKSEKAGMFVLLEGNLGSYHTDIEPEEFRGIALVDTIAPFVVINKNDAKAAHTFTLLHELAHIWLGSTGISNLSAFDGEGEILGVEAFCNKVATEFLMPIGPFQEAWRRIRRDDLETSVAELAGLFSISRAATANRLWKLGSIRGEDWWALYNGYQEEWRRHRERQREQEGGPSYYTTKRSQLGTALIRTVLGALDVGSITYTRASRILGVNAKSFDGLRSSVG